MAVRCPNYVRGKRCHSEYIIEIEKDHWLCNSCKNPVVVMPGGVVPYGR